MRREYIFMTFLFTISVIALIVGSIALNNDDRDEIVLYHDTGNLNSSINSIHSSLENKEIIKGTTSTIVLGEFSEPLKISAGSIKRWKIFTEHLDEGLETKTKSFKIEVENSPFFIADSKAEGLSTFLLQDIYNPKVKTSKTNKIMLTIINPPRHIEILFSKSSPQINKLNDAIEAAAGYDNRNYYKSSSIYTIWPTNYTISSTSNWQDVGDGEGGTNFVFTWQNVTIKY